MSAAFGVHLDPWQELILEAGLGERRNGQWAARRVGVTVPRQNGKTYLMVARALAGVLLFGEKKIVISAHQQDTAREAFDELVAIIEDDANAALRARVHPDGIFRSFNREQVRFVNGSRIQFKARSGAAGKGFSSDCLLLDEAQILGSRAWTSINSTMSARPNPQVWLFGTAPQAEDDSFAFQMVREAALNGESSASAWIEWGADPSAPDYDPASEYTRWKANPAWNSRINHEVVDGEFETYSLERFAQDRLGVWESLEKALRVYDADTWAAGLVDARPEDLVPGALGVASSVDGADSAIVAAAISGAQTFIKVLKFGPGMGWVVEEAKTLAEQFDVPIAIDSRGPAASFIPLLERDGVDVQSMSTPMVLNACAQFDQLVLDGLLKYEQAVELDEAIENVTRRKVGDRWAWGRKSKVSIAPLEAATLAAWAAMTFNPEPVSAYESRGVLTV